MRLVAKGVIGDIPWPLAEPLEEFEIPAFKKEDLTGPESPKEDAEPEVKLKSWDAYKYLFGDPDFEKFKAAYENLGEDCYQNALRQLGWTAVATSEECRQIADLMSVMDSTHGESTEMKF